MAEEVIIKQEPEMVDVTTGGKVIGQITPDQLEATKIPALDTKPLDISGLVSGVKTDTAAITQEVLRRQKEQEEQTKKTISEETGITAPTAREQLIKFTGTRPVSEALTFRKTEEEARGVTGLEEKVASQNIKVAQASENLTTLEAEKQSAIQNVETQPISRSFKEVQKNQIERDYNTKIAQATAKLSAESAMSEALSGNLTNARNLVNDAIEAYTYDINNEIDRFDSLKSTYSDWVDALDSDEKDALNLAYNELQTQRDELKEEKTEVGDLMISYNRYGAGITLDDDIDTAKAKAAKGETTKSEEGETSLDFTDQEKRKLQALGIDYTTRDGYEKALNILYNPNQYLSNEDRKEKLMSAITETMQESLGEYFTLDPNRLKLTAEDYLSIQRAWEDLSGTSSDFKIYFPIGQYMDESEQEAYKNLTGKSDLDEWNSFIKSFEFE